MNHMAFYKEDRKNLCSTPVSRVSRDSGPVLDVTVPN